MVKNSQDADPQVMDDVREEGREDANVIDVDAQEVPSGEAGGEGARAEGEAAGEGAGSAREEAPRPRQPTYVETLERRLQETQDQLREYIQAYKQVKEDKEEFKRRLDREKQKDLETLRGRLVLDLLDVLDNLDRSVMGGEAGWNAQAMLQGVKMVQNQFLEKLQALGMTVIDPLGQPFNPNEAEALDVSVAETADQDDRVSRVYSRGYRLNDRVIRPARVQVARYGEG